LFIDTRSKLKANGMQLDLFSAINEAYSSGLVDNQSVYDNAATKTQADLSLMVGPVGKNHQRVNT
jgi:hypothetical protein